MKTVLKFNRQDFDKKVNQDEFDLFLSNCKLSMEGKDGFYTRNDAFKSGVMIAYHLLNNSEVVPMSDYEKLERQDELNRAKIRQLESQILAFNATH